METGLTEVVYLRNQNSVSSYVWSQMKTQGHTIRINVNMTVMMLFFRISFLQVLKSDQSMLPQLYYIQLSDLFCFRISHKLLNQ
jgi:hypothetical protein